MQSAIQRAIVQKFFERLHHLGVSVPPWPDACPYVAEAGTALCLQEQKDKDYREGTLILEIIKKDDA